MQTATVIPWVCELCDAAIDVSGDGDPGFLQITAAEAALFVERTGHLLEKEWMADTDWSALCRKVAGWLGASGA